MFNIGPTELIVILILALIIFGPSRLPEIGRTVGKSLREVRRATQDIRKEIEGGMDDDWSGPADDPANIGPPIRPGTPAPSNGQAQGVTGSPLSGSGSSGETESGPQRAPETT